MAPALESLPRRRRRSLLNGLTVMVAIAAAGAGGLVLAVDQRVTSVREVPGVAEVLSPVSSQVENYLLVGSDSRDGVDTDDPVIGLIGTTAEVSGQRADTIMVLRRDLGDGSLALMSLPRDLWVPIAGGVYDRLNAAYGRGPDVLVRTVSDSLGIPVHHYVEVDLARFQGLVEAVGGVRWCVDTPVRDLRSGLDVPLSGCHVLDRSQSLAYVRSRAYEVFEDGGWRKDPTGDLGRMERQRAFVLAIAASARQQVLANPFSAASVVDAVMDTLGTDAGFDVLDVAGRLRGAATGDVESVRLPVSGASIEGKSVLQLAPGAREVLDWFAGIGERPPST